MNPRTFVALALSATAVAVNNRPGASTAATTGQTKQGDGTAPGASKEPYDEKLLGWGVSGRTR